MSQRQVWYTESLFRMSASWRILCPMATNQEEKGTDPKDVAALRDWLRQLVKTSGVSQAELARSTGIDRRNIVRWLSEKDPVEPGGVDLLTVLRALEVKIEPLPPTSKPLNEQISDLTTEVEKGMQMVADGLAEMKTQLQHDLKKFDEIYEAAVASGPLESANPTDEEREILRQESRKNLPPLSDEGEGEAEKQEQAG